jgi:hypothetical protein
MVSRGDQLSEQINVRDFPVIEDEHVVFAV